MVRDELSDLCETDDLDANAVYNLLIGDAEEQFAADQAQGRPVRMYEGFLDDQ